MVFRLPKDDSVDYIKRVIGLPGDRIQMRAGRLWINGSELALKPDGTGTLESADGSAYPVAKFVETLPGGVTHPILKQTWSGPYDNTGVYVVPAGHLFMMGDNRDDSLDSRVAAADDGVGYVPVENLVGKAQVIVGSYDYLGVDSLADLVGKIRGSRFFKTID